MADEQPKQKKPYPGKPEIFFESFAMSTSIAADCEVTRTNANNSYECGYISTTGQSVFSMPYISGCDKRGYTDGYDDPGDNLGTICRGIWGNEGYPNLWKS